MINKTFYSFIFGETKNHPNYKRYSTSTASAPINTGVCVTDHSQQYTVSKPETTTLRTLTQNISNNTFSQRQSITNLEAMINAEWSQNNGNNNDECLGNDPNPLKGHITSDFSKLFNKIFRMI